MTDSPIQRVGHRDRHKVTACLTQALGQGYLQFDEYDQRVQQAFKAQTSAELRNLLADLPVDRIRRVDPLRRVARINAARRGRRIHFSVFILMAITVLVVWAAVAATTSCTSGRSGQSSVTSSATEATPSSYRAAHPPLRAESR